MGPARLAPAAAKGLNHSAAAGPQPGGGQALGFHLCGDEEGAAWVRRASGGASQVISTWLAAVKGLNHTAAAGPAPGGGQALALHLSGDEEGAAWVRRASDGARCTSVEERSIIYCQEINDKDASPIPLGHLTNIRTLNTILEYTDGVLAAGRDARGGYRF